jgi:hypothetical protein
MFQTTADDTSERPLVLGIAAYSLANRKRALATRYQINAPNKTIQAA